MPTTYNGIGTHYYGKRNVQTRTGTCRRCGQVGPLDSYDTRLWFVVLLVPVFPLGRKRILDYCRRCSGHFAADSSKFEMGRQLNVSGAREQFDSAPSVESALRLHATLLGFHMHEEAAQFRQEASERFADQATLLTGLADHLEQTGRPAEAGELYERALVLRPELPEARVGVAHQKMASGDLDEARVLLGFLEDPGAGQLHSFAPLEQLAYLYQQQKRHEDTLALCERLIRELPGIADIHKFREFVRTSERALGKERPASILPGAKRTWLGRFDLRNPAYSSGERFRAYATVAALLAIAGLCGLNEYYRRHRQVHVVHADGGVVQLSIDGAEPISVANGATFAISEGAHTIRVRAPIEDEVAVALHSGFWSRWTKKPVWVLNIGGQAALGIHHLEYAETPQQSPVDLVVGESFTYVPHVDYAFIDAPQTMQLPRRNSVVRKTQLSRLDVPVGMLFDYLLNEGNRESALKLAESRLRWHPDDASLLRKYSVATEDSPEFGRSNALIEAGLWSTPWRVEWHRTFLARDANSSREAEFRSKYDELLTRSPDDGTLLYLRGRVEPQRKLALDFFQRSVAAAPDLAWPHMALAYDAAGRGEFAEALVSAENARTRGLDDPAFHHLHHVIRMGLGQFEGMVEEYQRPPATPEQAVPLLLRLCDAAVATGLADNAEWVQSLPAHYQDADFRKAIDSITGYMLGEDTQAELWTPETNPLRNMLLFDGWAASGKSARVAEEPVFEMFRQEAWTALALSLGFALEGNGEQADLWRTGAAKQFQESDADESQIGELLLTESAPTRGQLDEIEAPAAQKALLCALLAQRFPQQAPELLALAERLNVTRMPPYRVVRAAIERGRGVQSEQTESTEVPQPEQPGQPAPAPAAGQAPAGATE